MNGMGTRFPKMLTLMAERGDIPRETPTGMAPRSSSTGMQEMRKVTSHALSVKPLSHSMIDKTILLNQYEYAIIFRRK